MSSSIVPKENTPAIKKIKKLKIKQVKKNETPRKTIPNDKNMIIKKKEVHDIEEVMFTPNKVNESTLLDVDKKNKGKLVMN